jgi:hypothetical protein
VKLLTKLRGFATALACFGLLAPSTSYAGTRQQVKKTAAPASVAKVQTNDVVLQAGGLLRGRVVDNQGRSQKQVQISLTGAKREEVAAVTDAAGRFEIAGLKSGVYNLKTPQSVRVVRLWNNATAPPAAEDGILVVNTSQVIRGNGLGGSLLANPLIIGAAIATAVAVPIAVNNSRPKTP